jgi:hypothetical protein
MMVRRLDSPFHQAQNSRVKRHASLKAALTAAFAASLGLLLPVSAAGQAKSQAAKPANLAAPNAKAPKARGKLPLNDLTFVSTAQEARDAAKASATKKSEKSAAAPRPSKSHESGNLGVVELQPARVGASTGSESGAVHPNHQKKSVLKNVHGTVYGSEGAAGQATDGAVGASSRNGKSHIFIEGQHANSPTPH